LGSIRVFGQSKDPNAAEVLRHYKESLSWQKSVSMKMVANVDSNDHEFFPQTLDFVFRRDGDNNRAEWLGRQLIFGSGGDIDVFNSDFVKEIADGNMFVSLEGMRLVEQPDSRIDSRRIILLYNYTERLKALLENPNFGGPLFGKMYGSNYKSVADLLGESSDLHIHDEKENINGMACFVLEGTSKYGKVTAWIAPEKGYNAMKWVIEKDSHHLFDDAAVSKKWPSVEGGQVLFNVKELHEIIGEDNTVFAPKLAYFTHITNFRDGTKNVDHFEYKTSDIQLNPDFEALGAFKMDVPNGTRVVVVEHPGFRYVWENGKIVPAEDPAFEEIDKIVEELKKEQQ
jgi:hypothetical protein